ncbi:MAG: DUF177 domain-containing protein [Gemmatimonadota bacterium]|jgi:uncharacterized protein
MLIIDLRRLAEAPLEVVGQIDREDPLWRGSGVDLLLPLSARGTAEAAGGGVVRVHGSFESRAGAACRRCLKPVDLDVAEEFDLVFDPSAKRGDEDLTLYRLDPNADELDLRETLRERLLLAVSEYPLCRKECRGLCPHCGADLNATECDCSTTESDPRWAPLLTLRGEGEAGANG